MLKNKFLNFLDWGTEHNMDIIGISETNLVQKEQKFLIPNNSDYTGIWTSKDNKIKGSEVGLLINSKWKQHISFKRFIDHYLIHITLFFKGCSISIIQIYVLPNNNKTQL